MAKLDCIKLSNMGFYAFHGVTRAERSVGQRFYLDVSIYLDLKAAGASDDVKDTVDYQKVYNLIQDTVSRKKYKLIEALAEDIAEAILAGFHNIARIEVSVRKPNVPLTGILDYVEVTINRENIKPKRKSVEKRRQR